MTEHEEWAAAVSVKNVLVDHCPTMEEALVILSFVCLEIIIALNADNAGQIAEIDQWAGRMKRTIAIRSPFQ